MKPRTKARSIALQVLYECDLTNHPPAPVIEERLEEENLIQVWLSLLIKLSLVYYQSPAGWMISLSTCPEWPLDQVAVIDRNILRIALWEFAVEDVRQSKWQSTKRRACSYSALTVRSICEWRAGSLANRQRNQTEV